MMRTFPALLCLVAVGATACAASEAPPVEGLGHSVVEVGKTPIEVFTYRPSGCAITAVLIVFHGVDRNAGPYRDDAIPLGQRGCMFVVAPLFDAARFPSWRYQRGGVEHDDVPQPRSEWAVTLVPGLIAWARQQTGQPTLPDKLIGHSAGAQFLSRVAAYGTGDASRIVIANPSTWVRPSVDVMAPYGFGGLLGPAEREAALRRYLALPITVLLGGDDTGTHDLATSRQARAQGANRYERGEAIFAEAKAAAQSHGWPFGWNLAVVPGVGHNARRMFASEAAAAALAP